MRHDIRLKHFDYRSPGIYLVTLVTAVRSRTLARVTPTSVEVLPFGEVVRRHIDLLPGWRPQLEVTDHVVMPDHVHLILTFLDVVPAGLGAVVGCFKAGVTREINRLRGTEGANFWQHNYWERVVRSDAELTRYRQYLADNPRRWREKHGLRP